MATVQPTNRRSDFLAIVSRRAIYDITRGEKSRLFRIGTDNAETDWLGMNLKDVVIEAYNNSDLWLKLYEYIKKNCNYDMLDTLDDDARELAGDDGQEPFVEELVDYEVNTLADGLCRLGSKLIWPIGDRFDW